MVKDSDVEGGYPRVKWNREGQMLYTLPLPHGGHFKNGTNKVKE